MYRDGGLDTYPLLEKQMNLAARINSNLFTSELSGPAPAACAAASVTWSVNGNTCKATASASGGNSSAKDITSLTTGSAAFGDHHAR